MGRAQVTLVILGGSLAPDGSEGTLRIDMGIRFELSFAAVAQ